MFNVLANISRIIHSFVAKKNFGAALTYAINFPSILCIVISSPIYFVTVRHLFLCVGLSQLQWAFCSLQNSCLNTTLLTFWYLYHFMPIRVLLSLVLVGFTLILMLKELKDFLALLFSISYECSPPSMPRVKLVHPKSWAASFYHLLFSGVEVCWSNCRIWCFTYFNSVQIVRSSWQQYTYGSEKYRCHLQHFWYPHPRFVWTY